MISLDYARLMARYNRWQNESLYRAAAGLSDEARREDQGAFFGSIHGTLSHLMWGDAFWMHRFAELPKPTCGIEESATAFPDWKHLAEQRPVLDRTIIEWVSGLDAEWLTGDLTWLSGSTGKQMSKPRALLITHFFNHQTHHRGQVHAMLTAAGAKPERTDLVFMPESA